MIFGRSRSGIVVSPAAAIEIEKYRNYKCEDCQVFGRIVEGEPSICWCCGKVIVLGGTTVTLPNPSVHMNDPTRDVPDPSDQSLASVLLEVISSESQR